MAARSLDLIINTQTGQLLSGFNSTTQNGSTPSFVFGDLTPITCRLVQPSGSAERPWADIDLTNQEVHVAIGTPGSYPTAGTFTLTYGANTTTPLAFDASAATVAAALNLLASIISAGGVSVTSAAGGSYRIVFTSVGVRTAITTNTTALYPTSTSFIAVAQTGSASVQEVVVIRMETQPAAYVELTDDLPVAAATVTTVRAGSAGVSEIQKLTFDPIPYDGIYTLAYDGEETTDLAWDSTAEEIQAALIALTDVDTTGISVTGSFPTFTITFLSTYSNVSQLTVAADSLIVPTGKKGSISLNTTGVVEILSGATRADVTIEVQVVDTVTGDTWTTLQSPAILREDIISNSPASQTAGPVYILESVAEARYVRYDAAQTLTAPNKLQAVTNLGFTTAKATPVDADKVAILDSAASDAPKHVTGTNLKAFLKTYLDTLYVALTGNQTIAGDKTLSGNTVINGNLTVDGTTFYVNATDNRVGVGTTTPSTHGGFHVVGGISTFGGQTVTQAKLGSFSGYAAVWLSDPGAAITPDFSNYNFLKDTDAVIFNAPSGDVIKFRIANGADLVTTSTTGTAISGTLTVGGTNTWNGSTIAGAQAFSSTTRPTSSGTGTPASNSLVTSADVDAKFAKVSAYKSTDQTALTTGAYNKITFDTEVYDTASAFASSTFTAPVAGYVQVNVSVYKNGTTGADALAIYKNGTQHKRLMNHPIVRAATIVNGTATIQVAANDTLEIYYFAQNATDIIGASTITWVMFTMIP